MHRGDIARRNHPQVRRPSNSSAQHGSSPNRTFSGDRNSAIRLCSMILTRIDPSNRIPTLGLLRRIARPNLRISRGRQYNGICWPATGRQLCSGPRS